MSLAWLMAHGWWPPRAEERLPQPRVDGWQGFMSIEQVEILERTFATLTEDGWVIPAWVLSLRAKVEHQQRLNALRKMVALIDTKGSR